MHSPLISASDQRTAAATSAALINKARFWNRIARKYASDPIADLAGYERTLQRVQALLSTENEVLEIGCGTGSTALRLAPATRRLVATDVAEQMIAIACAKLASQPMPQLHFKVADADAPAAEQGAYDAVLAFNLLHLVTDLPQALSSAINALKPGGLLISKTPCLNEMNPLIPKLVLPLLRAIGKAPPVLCFDARQLQAAMTAQGLQILAVERHGSKGKDWRVFIVARKPNSPTLAA
ncbi:MAG: class I SAM-dependent methyltransferase [Pseudomonas sp.]|uniref:class I SAM-dependent methyltransferase n=1 Tax=Pseudomonas sp. TaxID=306 RepID=UPI002716B6D8|nr:class I SAM-dependent methyltransferase [Pseudomonas sp.]MDO9617483.1 class I SAM-dependent methyltransferase [Pseudomonas sp.]MDP2443886.1 class I SAM-dependent methyltransferase [Pseudomonas sp.]